MPQCTPSSFSKSLMFALTFSGILLGSIAAQTPAPASPQGAATQTDAKPIPELQGQISNLLGEITAKFSDLKKKEDQEKTGKSLEDLARTALGEVLNPRHAIPQYAVILADPAAAAAARTLKIEADESRVDKQIGSTSSGSGSTSLTSHGSVPAILGFAVENGGLQRSVSGTTITFRARPVQVIQALQRTPFDNAYSLIEKNGSIGLLNRFSFAVSFDTSRGNSSGTFTGSTNQVSAFTTTVDIYNHRDPRDKRNAGQWTSFQNGVGNQLAHSLYDAYGFLTDATSPFKKPFDAWLAETISALVPPLAEGRDNDFSAALASRVSLFPPVPPGLQYADPLLKQLALNLEAMQSARQNIFTYVAKSPILTFEYTDNVAAKASSGQMQLPDNSNFKLIFEKGLNGGGSFTSNFSATIFNSKPTGVVANQLRDLQASFQVDIPVNTSFPKLGNVVASLSGKYEHIPSDSFVGMVQGVTPITSDATLKGNLGIGQAKITFPVKGSGVKIPLSITWANRTELIKEKDVRGNIGITFDMDTIISKLKQ